MPIQKRILSKHYKKKPKPEQMFVIVALSKTHQPLILTPRGKLVARAQFKKLADSKQYLTIRMWDATLVDSHVYSFQEKTCQQEKLSQSQKIA